MIIRGQLSTNEKIIISREKAVERENIFSSNCKIQMGVELVIISICNIYINFDVEIALIKISKH